MVNITAGSLAHVREYFGIRSLADFKTEWDALTEKDKTDIKSGLANGTLTY